LLIKRQNEKEGIKMTNSLSDSTVEAFAAKAGLKFDQVYFHEFATQFEVHSGDRVFVAKFFEGTTPVAKFYEAFEDGSVKFLTREEASDLLKVISRGLDVYGAVISYEWNVSADVNSSKWGVIRHLEKNLPNIGFRPDTPTMTYRAPQPVVQNAKEWRWSLNDGPL